MTIKEQAIAARDKITWSNDCWNDVNTSIRNGNYEIAIELAIDYIQQQQARTSRINLGM